MEGKTATIRKLKAKEEKAEMVYALECAYKDDLSFRTMWVRIFRKKEDAVEHAGKAARGLVGKALPVIWKRRFGLMEGSLKDYVFHITKQILY